MGKRLVYWAATAVVLLSGFWRADGEGIITETGVESTLAIVGAGYFELLDPASGLLFATRWGEFWVDSNGRLVSPAGYLLQGYSDGTLKNFGTVNVNPPPGTDAEIVTYTICTNGKVFTDLSDGTEVCTGQILLQTFGAPANLTPFLDLLSIITPLTLPLPVPAVPGTDGLGLIYAGELETPIPTLTMGFVTPQSQLATQGVLYPTGSPQDFAIQGKGFFEVRALSSG